MTAMLIALANLVGIPPTSGFVSKWYLVTASFHSGYFLFGCSLLFAGLVNVVVLFRVVEVSFGFTSSSNSSVAETVSQEVGMLMWAPAAISASLLILLGVNAQKIVQLFLVPYSPFL